MSPKKVDISAFLNALKELDAELGLINHKISINAIGGFALMYWKIRTSQITEDIDSLTHDYSDNVKAAIQAVAKKLDLEEDWLNNFTVDNDDPDHVIEEYGVFFDSSKAKFSNIELNIASPESLFSLKCVAVDDQNSKRPQDLPDLLDIAKYLKIYSKADLDAKFPTLQIEFPVAYQKLIAVF